MEKPQIDYEKVDAGVRDLVRKLNELPFVATISSCEGHLKERAGWPNIRIVEPDKSYIFIRAGTLVFKIDKQHKEAQKFLEDIANLREKYPFIKLERLGRSNEIAYYLGYSDLPSSFQIKDEPSIDDITFVDFVLKKEFQVDEIAGRKRIEDYKKVWADLQAIVDKYLQ